VVKIWDIIQSFKDTCQSLGWRASENEDWIYLDKKYHNFLWTKTIHPSAFKKIAKASKVAVKEGVSYHVVNVDYSAWLFSETPREELVKMVIHDHNLGRTTALYDLSGMNSSRPTCLKLNSTESKVFRMFEDYLRKKWGVEFRSAEDIVATQV